MPPPLRLARFVLLAPALLSLACSAGAALRSSPARQVVDDPQSGWRLELPASANFLPGTREGEAARTASGILVQVQFEHFGSPPDATACWQRLGRRLQKDPDW